MDDKEETILARTVVRDTLGHLRVDVRAPDVVVVAFTSETYMSYTEVLKYVVDALARSGPNPTVATPEEAIERNLLENATAVIVVWSSQLLGSRHDLIRDLRESTIDSFGIVVVESKADAESVFQTTNDLIVAANSRSAGPCFISATVNVTTVRALTARKIEALKKMVELANSGQKVAMNFRRISVGQARCYLKAAHKVGQLTGNHLSLMVFTMVRTFRALRGPKSFIQFLSTNWYSKFHGALLCNKAYKKKYNELAVEGIVDVLTEYRMRVQADAFLPHEYCRYIYPVDEIQWCDGGEKPLPIEEFDSWDDFRHHYTSMRGLDKALRSQDVVGIIEYLRKSHGCRVCSLPYYIYDEPDRRLEPDGLWNSIRGMYIGYGRVIPKRHSWAIAVLLLEGLKTQNQSYEKRVAVRAAAGAVAKFDATALWYDPFEDYGYPGDGQPAAMAVIAQRWRARAAALATLCAMTPLWLHHEPRARKHLVTALEAIVVGRLSEVLEEIYGPDQPGPIAYSPLLMAIIAIAFSYTTPAELAENTKARTLRRAKRAIEYSFALQQKQKIMEFETFPAKVTGVSIEYLAGNVLIVQLKPFAKDPCPAFPSICLAMRWGTKIAAFYLEDPNLLPEDDHVCYGCLESFRTKVDVLGGLPISTPLLLEDKDHRGGKKTIAYSELYASAMNDPTLRDKVRSARRALQVLWKEAVGRGTVDLHKESREAAGSYTPSDEHCVVVRDEELLGGHTRASLKTRVDEIISKMGLNAVKEATVQLPITEEIAACATAATMETIPRWALATGPKTHTKKVRELYICWGLALPKEGLPPWLDHIPNSEVPEAILARLHRLELLNPKVGMCCVCLEEIVVRDLEQMCSNSESHRLCSGCLGEWRQHANTCPLCRAVMFD